MCRSWPDKRIEKMIYRKRLACGQSLGREDREGERLTKPELKIWMGEAGERAWRVKVLAVTRTHNKKITAHSCPLASTGLPWCANTHIIFLITATTKLNWMLTRARL